jgi:hypothetical protein
MKENTISLDTGQQILEQLIQINGRLSQQKRDADTLSAKDIEQQYNINYARVLKYFNDPRLNVMDDIKPKLVMRCEWERYLKKIYNIKE